uniref:histone acetyltransferase n=1 Tax=Haptolina ericina TaxID=156174 RepID=A0A7S3F288_9EUKA
MQDDEDPAPQDPAVDEEGKEAGMSQRGMSATAPSASRPQRLKGVPMFKSVSEDLVVKVQKQMRRMAGHFLVATLTPLEASEGVEGTDLDAGSVSFDAVNSRQSMIFYCQSHALQFNSLRYAQYSTAMLIYEMLHPSEPTEVGGTYCLPTCHRNRKDDGSMMIACDACDNWLHPSCCGKAGLASEDDSFVCPACLETQADVYLADTFGSEAEELIGGADLLS